MNAVFSDQVGGKVGTHGWPQIGSWWKPLCEEKGFDLITEQGATQLKAAVDSREMTLLSPQRSMRRSTFYVLCEVGDLKDVVEALSPLAWRPSCRGVHCACACRVRSISTRCGVFAQNMHTATILFLLRCLSLHEDAVSDCPASSCANLLFSFLELSFGQKRLFEPQRRESERAVPRRSEHIHWLVRSPLATCEPMLVHIYRLVRSPLSTCRPMSHES